MTTNEHECLFSSKDERLRDFKKKNSKQITSSQVMNQSEAIFGKETGKLKNS